MDQVPTEEQKYADWRQHIAALRAAEHQRHIEKSFGPRQFRLISHIKEDGSITLGPWPAAAALSVMSAILVNLNPKPFTDAVDQLHSFAAEQVDSWAGKVRPQVNNIKNNKMSNNR